MIPGLNPQALAAAALAGALIGAGLSGWAVHRMSEARALACEAQAATAARAAADQAARDIEAARQAAEQATVAAQARAEVAETLARRYRGEIDRLAKHRPCLSHELRGLLQQSPAFLPGPAGGAAGPAAALATDPRYRTADSTDADVARWVFDAAVMYESCRARIDALRRTYADGR